MSDDGKWSGFTSPQIEHCLAITARTALQRQLHLCESPAEVAMLVGLVANGGKPMATPTDRWEFVLQHPIDRFRVDFAFPISKVAIEVDGFRYHDSTPEQAERDKSREREFAVRGWQTIRFAAREVMRAPEESAFSALEIVMQRAPRVSGKKERIVRAESRLPARVLPPEPPQPVFKDVPMGPKQKAAVEAGLPPQAVLMAAIDDARVGAR